MTDIFRNFLPVLRVESVMGGFPLNLKKKKEKEKEKKTDSQVYLVELYPPSMDIH